MFSATTSPRGFFGSGGGGGTNLKTLLDKVFASLELLAATFSTFLTGGILLDASTLILFVLFIPFTSFNLLFSVIGILLSIVISLVKLALSEVGC